MPTSQARLEANRRNALRSTGPKTVEGRALVAHNATKHGLLAKDALLPTEDGAVFDELTAELVAQLNPVGRLEAALVDRMAGCLWRLHRLSRVEAGLLAQGEAAAFGARARQFTRSLIELPEIGEEIIDAEAHITLVERQQAILAEARDVLPLATAWTQGCMDGDPLAKLNRYEASLERSFYRALHELQRLQAMRRGEKVTAPAVADVIVSAPE